MEKKHDMIADVIPQRPASFDEAVERTLARVCQNTTQTRSADAHSWTQHAGKTRKQKVNRLVKRIGIGVIAAEFVICAAVIGTVVALRSHSDSTELPAAVEAGLTEAFSAKATSRASDPSTTPPTQQADGTPVVEALVPAYPGSMTKSATMKTVRVSTVDELLAAIAPDTEIILEDGTYTLSSAKDYGHSTNVYYMWQDGGDGYELELRSLNDLHIIGSGNAEINTEPRGADVISAYDCSGLVFSGFTVGHTIAAGECEGGVILLNSCTNSRIESCSLFGCGTLGVNAFYCDTVLVTDCDIYDCSEGAVSFCNCQNVWVADSKLRECTSGRYYETIEVRESENVYFSDCDVFENTADEAIFRIVESGVVILKGVSVKENIAAKIFDVQSSVIVIGCEFSSLWGSRILPEGQIAYDRYGNRLRNADLAAMKLERTSAAQPAATATPTQQTGDLAAYSDISLEGLVSMDDVLAYLDTVLPYDGDEELIPYAADIYHYGDNTFSQMLFGFCTRSGKIVTKPVFSSVRKVSAVGDDWPAGTTSLYLCDFPGLGYTGWPLYTPKGAFAGWAMESQGRYEEPYPNESEIAYGMTVVDDGFYYMDGYVSNDGHVADVGPTLNEDGHYTICRRSDGAKVAVTDWWDGLLYEHLGDGGRLYFTRLDDVIYTYDQDFNLILRVPAVGAKSNELFESTAEQTH